MGCASRGSAAASRTMERPRRGAAGRGEAEKEKKEEEKEGGRLRLGCSSCSAADPRRPRPAGHRPAGGCSARGTAPSPPLEGTLGQPPSVPAPLCHGGGWMDGPRAALLREGLAAGMMPHLSVKALKKPNRHKEREVQNTHAKFRMQLTLPITRSESNFFVVVVSFLRVHWDVLGLI